MRHKNYLLSSGLGCAVLFAAPMTCATDVAALHLAATASGAEVDEPVTLVLTATGLPAGTPIALHPALGARLWQGIPDCAAADHTHTTVALTQPREILCMSSPRAQSLRAVVSAQLPNGTTVVGSSEPIKFVEAEHWWKTTLFTSAIAALAGAVWGLCSTLIAQTHERRRKAADEKLALGNEQEQFLVRNLLPELATHLQILNENDALPTGQETQVQSLPKTHLVTLAKEARAKRLAAYFTAVNLDTVSAEFKQYSEAAGDYNLLAAKVKRNAAPLSELTTKGQALRPSLASFGFS